MSADHQSPIAPGLSWYQANAGERPQYPKLDCDLSVDVVIIGGGFTGLSAAAELAKLGTSVALIEAHRFGDGASGRNGGQLGTGQRAWADDDEAAYGYERAKALFDLAEEAKAHLLGFAAEHNIEIDYHEGHYSAAHKRRYLKDYRAHADTMAARFDYPHLTYLNAEELAARIGTDHYYGGVHDAKTGHIQPLKLVIGTAKVAAQLGAQLFEQTPATTISRNGNHIEVKTAHGTIKAQRALIATNAYNDGLDKTSSAHIMPIRSFIGVTEPLDNTSTILPNFESVDDSRFVVRYFRRTRDGRLIFGGREAYTADEPGDISRHIRKQIADVYPALKDVEISHTWGGSVGITMPRLPFVRDVAPGITSIGGYSGHGVMLSNFTGKLYAQAISGNRDQLQMFRDFKVPAFPGGQTFRKPLLILALTWFAMLDRI